MATTIATIISNARRPLLEYTGADSNAFWSDAELLVHASNGVKDLWRAVIDLHQEHFLTIDASGMGIAASGAVVSGVPADLFRVITIEPRTLTSSGSNVQFVPKEYKSETFKSARAQAAQTPDQVDEIYYAVSQAGAPVAAPTIHVAPTLSSALTLRVAYIPTLAALTGSSTNPIPGESDLAIQAWITAFALAKEREDKMPDPAWLSIFATEKQAMLTALTPRQEQEPEYVQGMWESD